MDWQFLVGIGAAIVFGLLGFAVATGLLFGRVSRPSARIGFSEKALIAPYQEGTSFQFRMVNRRANTLIEPATTLMMMTVDRSNGGSRRDFTSSSGVAERLPLSTNPSVVGVH